MSQKTILVIEDEKSILELLKFNIEAQGYRALLSSRGDEGLEIALNEKPDLIVLDIMLPELSGFDICKAVRQNYKTKHTPIIMLTAKCEDADVVLGLEVGADDFVTKPFSVRQVLARIKAVLRRSGGAQNQELLTAGSLEMDLHKHVVTIAGKRIDLTSKEYGILKLLLEAGGRVLSREHILNSIWGHDDSINIELRAVDRHIGELRKKIKREADRILTIKNFGYRFEMEDLSKARIEESLVTS